MAPESLAGRKSYGIASFLGADKKERCDCVGKEGGTVSVSLSPS